jgi:hypothetical protein
MIFGSTHTSRQFEMEVEGVTLITSPDCSERVPLSLY